MLALHKAHGQDADPLMGLAQELAARKPALPTDVTLAALVRALRAAVGDGLLGPSSRPESPVPAGQPPILGVVPIAPPTATATVGALHTLLAGSVRS